MASITSIDRENQRLKTQVQELRSELQDKESQVILSAQFGKQLLESNTELNRQLEEIQESNVIQIEKLRQENYSLKMKMEGDSHSRENFTVEMDNLKLQLQEDASRKLSNVNATHNKKVEELGAEIDALHEEKQRNTLVTEQLQEKVCKQDEMLAEAHQYSKQLQEMDVLESVVDELKQECALTKFKNDELEICITDVNDTNNQLLFDQQKLVEKIEYLKENFEQKATQAKTWFDALQDSRQQVSELQMEVSVLKADALNRSHKEKGNSLFGEIEDKRLELQQKFSTVSTKYESLQKTHVVVKRQLHQYKCQILPMLQMARNQADSSKIKRLEAALSQSQNEVQRLYVKTKDLEKENKTQDSGTSRLEQLHDVATDLKGKQDFVAYLQKEISRHQETISDLKSKGEMTTMKLLAETDKRREIESVLHTCEVRKETLEHDVVLLRLKLGEMKIKLQQDGKLSTEKLQEPKDRRSIWKNSDLFTKKENPQEKLVYAKEVSRLDDSVSKRNTPSNLTDNVEHSPPKRVKSSNKSTEILPPKDVGTTLLREVKPLACAEYAPTTTKVKPIGRVTPLNGRSPNKENDCLVESTRREVVSEISEIIPPVLSESNDTPPVIDHIQGEINKASKKNSNEDVVKPRAQKFKRLDPHREHVIHVKKDQGSQNECQQQ